MARKPPAAVRAAHPSRSPAGMKLSVVDGVSARTVSEIQLIERSRLGPGAVARALAEWKRAVRTPAMLREATLCPCCDAREARDLLDRALSLLGPRARRDLWRKLKPLDERWERVTLLDPWASPDVPWWWARL